MNDLTLICLEAEMNESSTNKQRSNHPSNSYFLLQKRTVDWFFSMGK